MALAHDWKNQQHAVRAAMWTALVEGALLWVWLVFIVIISLILLFGA
jgi:hypothetical protein